MHLPPFAGMPRDARHGPPRTTPLLGLAMFIVIALIAWTAPPASAAIPHSATTTPRPVTTQPTYKGWGYVAEHTPQCVPNDIASVFECTSYSDPYVEAWSWTGTQWVRTYVIEGQQVYIWPFASGWSWAWTQPTGWLAMRSDRLVFLA